MSQFAIAYPNERTLVIPHPKMQGVRLIVHTVGDPPWIGGLRRGMYPHADAAREDCVGLARGMHRKNLLAGITPGGAKSVLYIPSHRLSELEQELVRSRLRELYLWAGQQLAVRAPGYGVSWDMGMDAELFAALVTENQYALGRASMAGDPSPATSMGVLSALESVLSFLGVRDGFNAVTLLVQGFGGTGGGITQRFLDACDTGSVVFHDTRYDAYARYRQRTGWTGSDRVHFAPSLSQLLLSASSAAAAGRVPVFVPCASSGLIDTDFISALRRANVALVCGSANTPFKDPIVGPTQLFDARIPSVPAEVANLGGVTYMSLELLALQSADGDESVAKPLFDRHEESVYRYLQMRASLLARAAFAEARVRRVPPEKVVFGWLLDGGIRGRFPAADMYALPSQLDL